MVTEKKGFLVLESGEAFPGHWLGENSVEERAGEVVFNTSHAGYEEIATDPSYFSQIMVTTASMQGNYGVSDEFWESKKMWISGFVCLEMQNTDRDATWVKKLQANGVPTLSHVDTRAVVLRLRSQGAVWGAVVQACDEKQAKEKAMTLISQSKDIPSDWCQQVCTDKVFTEKGQEAQGPRVAVIDFGSKTNILRELRQRCSEIAVFPSTTPSSEIKNWKPDGVMLSNGPGDPESVEVAPQTVKDLLGVQPVFGICMGHQILSRALGAKTYKLKFGHRGGNHPVKNNLTGEICMTSQNHGYAVDEKTLPENVKVSHINLNDNTVSGIVCEEHKCLGVQFHPESHPGPRDSASFFDDFILSIKEGKVCSRKINALKVEGEMN